MTKNPEDEGMVDDRKFENVSRIQGLQDAEGVLCYFKQQGVSAMDILFLHRHAYMVKQQLSMQNSVWETIKNDQFFFYKRIIFVYKFHGTNFVQIVSFKW